MARTALFRTALAADLADITTTNSFEITVAAVYAEPVDIIKRLFPSAAIVPVEGGQSDIETFGCQTGKTEQWFDVELFVKSATPHADVQKLLDSARNVVERPTSAMWAVTGVLQVDAVEWERIGLTDDFIGNGYAAFNLSIRVEYRYTRGAV